MATPDHTDLDYWLAETRARARVALRQFYHARFRGEHELAACLKQNYRLWKILERHIRDYMDDYYLGDELKDLTPGPFDGEQQAAALRCIEYYIRAASIKELYPCDDEPMGVAAMLWWEAAWTWCRASSAWCFGRKARAEQAEAEAEDIKKEASKIEQDSGFEFELPPSVRAGK